MRVFHSKRETLAPYAKREHNLLIYLKDIGEIYNHPPKLSGLTKVSGVFLYRGNVRETDLPKWEGTLYVIGSSDCGEELNPPLEDLYPILTKVRKAFEVDAWQYLTNRFQGHPNLVHWELSVLLEWWKHQYPVRPIKVHEIQEVLQLPSNESQAFESYKKLIGTPEGNRLLYGLKDSELWLIIHKYLWPHLERVNPCLLPLLIDIHRGCEHGLKVREQAIIFNSLVGQTYTIHKAK